MSEKEKALVEKIAALPDPLKQRILDQASGAAMALDMARDIAREQEEQQPDVSV